MIDISRRHFMMGVGALGCCGVLQFPGMALAAADTNKRLLLVILRGGMDGLGAVPAIGDRNYHDARGSLAMPDKALLPLDGYFALNASLKPLHTLYNNKELLILHAAASPYRERSHFDAQDLLENGSAQAHGLSTGWLARTLQALGGSTQGLAIGSAIPLVLQGSNHVQTWAPAILPEVDADFLARVMKMYQHDPVLSNALSEETGMDQLSGSKAKGPRQFIDMMKAAASLMKKDNGARIGSIDITGWDTHAGQGTADGRLASVLNILGEGVATFRAGMGDEWKNTAVLMVTEFGRTVAVNGSGGTDHGTASAAFLTGGTVKGGRVIGDWPGLASNKLYEGRDLYPANDLRSLVKAVLQQHLLVPSSVIEQSILPQSTGIRAFSGIFA